MLTNTLANFEDNRYIGYVVFNITDVSSGTVTDSNQTTVTVSALTGGTDDDWDVGDAYMLQRPVLDKDNFNGFFWDDCLWNGAVHRFNNVRLCEDSTGLNLRRKNSEFQFEDDGYIALRPQYAGSAETSPFNITNGQGKRIDCTGGNVAITLPTVASGIPLFTTQMFIRDETPSGSNAGVLQYDSVTDIMGVSGNFTLPSRLAKFEITYVGGTLGWLVTNE